MRKFAVRFEHFLRENCKKLLIFSDPTDCPTTYQVRCLFENNPQISYTATFFTSEVDKVKIKKKSFTFNLTNFFFFQRVSNLWTEYEEIIELCENDGINPILALAIDDLTENVFIITQNHEPLDQVIKTVFFKKKKIVILFSQGKKKRLFFYF